MNKIVVVIFSLFVLLTSNAVAETLRIGAWNIQDLHHKEGFSLRAFGDFYSVKRKSEDYELISAYRDLFGRDGRPADVIALQEIGTKAALERLFPSAAYETIMSPRWQSDDAEEGKGDVFTAVAIRKDSGVRLVDIDPLPELAVLHTDGRATRAGTGALLEYAGKRFWFLSVHLKSSCPKIKNLHKSKNDDCETLWAQAPILADWITAKRATGVPFIIAGDFNRRFRQHQHEGPLWNALNGMKPEDAIEEAWVVAHPESTTRQCPTRKGKSTQPIDWIILDESLSTSFEEGSFWERRFSQTDIVAGQNGRGLSDHCPISIDLKM